MGAWAESMLMLVTPSQLELDFLKSDLVRSPGLHASDIYGDLYKKLEPKRYDHDDEEPNDVLMALGTAWEKHFEYLLTANGIHAYRPPELLSPEGIAYSPDLILFNGHTRVGEIKLTSMSEKDLPEGVSDALPPKFNKYLCQMKLYAFWLELHHGWLGVVLLYKPYKPVFRQFNIEWTDKELESNYFMLMNHARHRGFLKGLMP